MALAGTFERLKPDFAGVGQVPAGDQKVVPGRLLVAFEAKRGIGDDDAVENFAQRHDGRHVGGDLAAQWTQHFGYQLLARIFAPGVVDQLAQGLDFPSFSRCSMVSCSVNQLLVRRAPGATAGVSPG